ncbi:MAG TPA: cation:proton antiporter [Solirubrobacteraceae bacterium]|nr:cation:proton antiporter [Solirubrobacteraceae bacterium]
MALGAGETAQLFLALALLLGAAHAGGSAFARVRQPRVIGEIVGGLVLGPTVFGALLPGLQHDAFPPDGAGQQALAAIYQLGLVLLMFLAGMELRTAMRRDERRVAASITIAGTGLPFAAGIAVAAVVDLDGLQGTAHDATSLTLVFAAAVAVTSIPVISRIMIDLGLIGTSFARIVLGAAVMEDIALYAVLAVAVGLSAGSADGYGLAHELGIAPASAGGAAYYAAATGAVLAAALLLARGTAPRPLLRGLARVRGSVPAQLIFLLAVTTGCLMLGVTPVFGGLVAGLVLARSGDEVAARSDAATSIRQFSLAFFVPLYFALVGFQLDLARDLDVPTFVAFLVFACAVKSASVYFGARIAGEARFAARNFAVAMNARGGPGIVLASVSLAAGIVDESFFTSMVMLAIVTSLAAGWWLERTVRDGDPPRPEPSGESGRDQARAHPRSAARS